MESAWPSVLRGVIAAFDAVITSSSGRFHADSQSLHTLIPRDDRGFQGFRFLSFIGMFRPEKIENEKKNIYNVFSLRSPFYFLFYFDNIN